MAKEVKSHATARIEWADESEIAGIKRIADDNKLELGFVLQPALAESLTAQRILVAKLDGIAGITGFLHYRHRKDRITKVYQICVDKQHRGKGVGEKLLDELRRNAAQMEQERLLLNCPEGLLANDFYRKYGFVQLGTLPGKRRRLIVWTLPLDEILGAGGERRK
jgi:ribosomal protein S18 acetylase RimI-like enzyme